MLMWTVYQNNNAFKIIHISYIFIFLLNALIFSSSRKTKQHYLNVIVEHIFFCANLLKLSIYLQVIFKNHWGAPATQTVQGRTIKSL